MLEIIRESHAPPGACDARERMNAERGGETLRVDLMGHLFGGILAVGALDLWWINLGGAAALAVLAGVVSVGVGLWASVEWNHASLALSRLENQPPLPPLVRGV